MTTLEQLQALTDEQLVEKVAVEVMGWEMMYYPFTNDWWWNESDEVQHDATWNPLTDWNHTMEVVERCIKNHCTFTVNMGRKNAWGTKRLDWVNVHNGNVIRELDDDRTQRAICIAALLAVSN